MKRTFLKHSFVLRAVLLLAACGGDDSSEDTGPPDAEVPIDAGSDAGTDAGMDAGPRTMVIGPSGSGLPTDNRIFLPEFRPLPQSSLLGTTVIGSTTDDLLARYVLADTPYRAVAMRTPGGLDAGMFMLGVAGDGEHTASVWVGQRASGDDEGDRDRLQSVEVSVVGMKIEDAGTEAVAVDLAAVSDSLIASDERNWMRYEGSFTARTGPFLMRVSAPATYVHAPLVQHVRGTSFELRVPRSRELSEPERAMVDRWRQFIRDSRGAR